MAALAQDYFGQSKIKQAVGLDTKVLEIRRRILGPEDKAKYAGAAGLLAKTSDIQRRVHGAEHPQTLTAMANLAAVDGRRTTLSTF